MRLILSTRHPRNSTYSTETRETLYKVDKPYKISPTVATIRKAVSTANGVWHNDSEQSKAVHIKGPIGEKSGLICDDSRQRIFPDDETALSESRRAVFESHFAFYAQIEFHKVQSTRFRYNGLDIPVREYFAKKVGRVLEETGSSKASDGKEYRWRLGAGCLDMITNDENKTQVVKFREYHPELGPLLKGRPGILEIDPSCEPLLDEVIMTFIYCHKLRKDSKD